MNRSTKMVMVLSGLVVLGLSAFALTTFNDDVQVNGHLMATGDGSFGGDILGGNNMSVNNSAQFGGTVNAADYTGTIFEAQAGPGNTCSASCNKWSTQSAMCVEAKDGAGSTVSCSGTVPSGNRYTCLCKT